MIIRGIKFCKYIKYLGVYLGNDKNECHTLNWENKLENFEKLLDNWKTKNLTLYTKIDFLKTYALAKLTFLLSLLHIPEGYLQKIEKAVYNFLWGKNG